MRGKNGDSRLAKLPVPYIGQNRGLKKNKVWVNIAILKFLKLQFKGFLKQS